MVRAPLVVLFNVPLVFLIGLRVLRLTRIKVHRHPVVVRVLLGACGCPNRRQSRRINRAGRKTLMRVRVVLIALIGLLLLRQVV